MEERIDRYLQGQMQPDEKTLFEEELKTNEVLQEELASTKLIADAIQRNALRDSMKRIENNSTQTILLWHKIAYSIAIAACLAGILFDIGIVRTYTGIRDYSENLYNELDAPLSRSANDVDNILQTAYSAIGTGDLKQASSFVEKAKEEITSGLTMSFGNDEITEYEHSIMLIQGQEAEWYSAIISMRNGQIKKARKILKEIANGKGIYASKAQEVLDSFSLI